MLPVVGIIITTLITLCSIYLDVHLCLAFFNIREGPLQHVSMWSSQPMAPWSVTSRVAMTQLLLKATAQGCQPQRKRGNQQCIILSTARVHAYLASAMHAIRNALDALPHLLYLHMSPTHLHHRLFGAAPDILLNFLMLTDSRAAMPA